MNSITNSIVSLETMPKELIQNVAVNLPDQKAYDAFTMVSKRIAEMIHALPLYCFPYFLRVRVLRDHVNLSHDVATLIPILKRRAFTGNEMVHLNSWQAIANRLHINHERQEPLLDTEKKLSESIYKDFERFCFINNDEIKLKEHRIYTTMFFQLILDKAKRMGLSDLKLNNAFNPFIQKLESISSKDYKERIDAYSCVSLESITLMNFMEYTDILGEDCPESYIARSKHISSDINSLLFNNNNVEDINSFLFNRDVFIIQKNRDSGQIKASLCNSWIKHKDRFQIIANECAEPSPSNQQHLEKIKNAYTGEKAKIEKQISMLGNEMETSQELDYFVRSRNDIDAKIQRLNDEPQAMLKIVGDFYNALCQEVTEENKDERIAIFKGIELRYLIF